MSYAVIKVGGKQYRVREGEHLLVDRLKTEPGKTFTPDVLLVDGELGARATVTVRVVENVLGEKIRIGKYRKRTGYKRHNGFRASLSKIQIESIGAQKAAPAKKAEPVAPAELEPAAAAKPAAAPKAEAPKEEAPRGLPKDYAGMTVAQISEAAVGWNRPMLEAAREYEQEHAKRKGALGAIESALAAKEDQA